MKEKGYKENVISMIGNTPLIRINSLSTKDLNFYAKLEMYNPSGSLKDRSVYQMIKEAESSGELKKGMTLIEPTSGNTGISLAMLGKQKGYEVIVVTPEFINFERRTLIRLYGAKIIYTKSGKGIKGAIRKAKEIVRGNPDKFFCLNQYENFGNSKGYHKAAEEIYNDMDGKIDAFVAGFGTSGTLMGIGEYLKKKDNNIKIVSAQPLPEHTLIGLKSLENEPTPLIFDKSKIDYEIKVNDKDAYEMTINLTRKEGISVGPSSGATMCAAIEYSRKIKKANIVVLFPDGVDRYMTTMLFNKHITSLKNIIFIFKRIIIGKLRTLWLNLSKPYKNRKLY